MIPTQLDRLASLADGRLIRCDDGTTMVTGVVRLDSRDVAPGDAFVAWAGEQVDGHDYVAEAARNGAVVALVDHEVDAPIAQIVVPDVLAALADVARDHARRLAPTCTILGITGSSGKTTTKDIVASVLAENGPTVSPPGSFNNEFGLPLTVLRADASTRFLVLEMGARGAGHIEHLMDIATPTIGAALNVGSAHVGEFGDADAIARAKSEIVATLPPTGVAVLNADDARVRAMRAVTEARVLTFGTADDADVRVSHLTLDSLSRPTFVLTFQDTSHPVRLQYSGAHNASNAAAAAAIAIAAGVPPEAAFSALERAQPTSRWRMEIQTSPRGVVVVNDAYNANPESVAAALRAVAAMDRHGHAWAVLGEMRELGDVSNAAHREVGRQAAEMRFDRLVAVGASPDVDALADAATAAGLVLEHVTRVADPEAAANVLLRECADGDVVLLKASRAIGLEVAAERLLQAGVAS